MRHSVLLCGARCPLHGARCAGRVDGAVTGLTGRRGRVTPLVVIAIRVLKIAIRALIIALRVLLTAISVSVLLSAIPPFPPALRLRVRRS